MSGFHKSKSTAESEEVDYKETKLGNGQRASFGINLASESIEDVFKHVSSNVYSRRLRNVGLKTGQDEARARSASKEHLPMTSEATEQSQPVSKTEELYRRWQDSGMKELFQLPKYSIYVSEEQHRSIAEVPEEERGRHFLRFVAKASQDKLRALVAKDMTIDATDRDTICETVEEFSKRLVESVISIDSEVHKMTAAHAAKHENPLNVFQKDRKQVINHVESIVVDIEKSINDAGKSLIQEMYKDLDEQLEQVTKELKVIEDGKGLAELFEGATLKQKQSFNEEFEPIMEEALRNERNIFEVFKELIHTDKVLQEAEQKTLKGMERGFQECLTTSSIEIVSGFLTPN